MQTGSEKGQSENTLPRINCFYRPGGGRGRGKQGKRRTELAEGGIWGNKKGKGGGGGKERGL